MNGMIQVSRSLSCAARVFHRTIHSGTRQASTVASKVNTESPLTLEEIFAREAKYGAHNYHPLPVALARGKGEIVLHGMLQITQKFQADTLRSLV